MKKFARNIKNDQLHEQQLQQAGWNVITVWECQLKKAVFDSTMRRLEKEIKQGVE